MIVGGQEHVAFAPGERHHGLVHLRRGQAAVGDADGQLGRDGLQLGGQGLHVLDPRRDEEALAAAPLLAHQRAAGRRGVERRQEGAHRPPARGRRLQEADVLHPRHRHLQRARDRRGGERQKVDGGREPSQVGLQPGAEALLLVDDEKAEVGERHVLCRQGVGGDHQPRLAGPEPRLHRFRLLGRGKARQVLDRNPRCGEARAERLDVLAHQHRRGRHERDLLAGHHRGGGGAQGDLRLAETDIAAHQPVHGPAPTSDRPAPRRSRPPGRGFPDRGSPRRSGRRPHGAGQGAEPQPRRVPRANSARWAAAACTAACTAARRWVQASVLRRSSVTASASPP